MISFASRLLATTAAVLALGTSTLAAQPFYEGKTVTLLVGFSPGGGTDRFARVVQQHLGEHIAGEPTVLVQNMPGAGSVLASNYYVDRAPRDGTMLMVGTGQLLMRILLGVEGSTARIADYEPLMAGPVGRVTSASADLGIDGPADLMDGGEELIVGSAGVMASIDTILGLRLLDVDFRAISGYEGKAETLLAMQRGEASVDGQTTPVYNATVRPLVEEGSVVPLFAQGFIDGEGNLVRDPAAPEIPTVLEVYQEVRGEMPSGPAWNAYMATTAATVVAGKVLMIQEDGPQEAKDALRAAIDSMVEDPDFLADVEDSLEGYDIFLGDDLDAAVQAAVGIGEEDLAWLRDYLSSEHGMRFDTN
ncbi:MAG: Bug family tripartite tricarboxylate transporter substrate binding protein [Salinarimonas sp.]